MKKTFISAAILASSAIVMAPAAHAADGTITFAGNVSAQTCTVTGGAGSDFTVTLPPVSAKTLETAGAVAGRTAFQLKLTGCAQDTGKVSTYFESGPTTNQATGNLILDKGDGNATNVEIGLLNNDTTAIKAGAAYGAQNEQYVSIAGGAATLGYFAEYHSLGSATAGKAATRVSYTLAYQ